MRICIYGAGAIGGLIATEFALAGESVTIIENNRQHLAAIRQKGLRLQDRSGRVQVARVNAVEDVADAGKQDIVVLAVKAQHLEDIASELRHPLIADSVIVTAQNGIPWWYFQKHGGELDGARLRSVDPSGRLSTEIEPSRIIGCVAYPAAAMIGPGIIEHVEGDRFYIGELDGRQTDRARRIRDIFVSAGLKSRVLVDIRAEIWLKACGALSFNPISALTRATMSDICCLAETRRLVREIMQEAEAVASKLGITFRHSIEKRIEGAESVGPHKTSMLQDVEAGRSLELNALLGAVLELGKLTDTPTPAIEVLYGLLKLLDKVVQEGRESPYDITC